MKKKYKKDILEKYIKNHLCIYLNCVIENPSFDSQTKERLITTASKFGSKPGSPDKIVKQLLEKTDLMNRVLMFTDFKLNKESKKTDGHKKSKIRDIPKLDDANWAGTKKSEECILILTEGDSAKTMAVYSPRLRPAVASHDRTTSGDSLRSRSTAARLVTKSAGWLCTVQSSSSAGPSKQSFARSYPNTSEARSNS